MSDLTTYKNSTKHQEIVVPAEEQNINQKPIYENIPGSKQKEKLPQLEEVKSSEINLDAFKQTNTSTTMNDTKESKSFSLKRSLDIFDKIYVAARFLVEDTDSKSPLFQNVESTYQAFMDKTLEKGASSNGNIYIQEFLLFRDAVIKYLEKNGGTKFTSRGRRRRNNMNRLLNQINAIERIPGMQDIPSAKNFSLNTAYMGKDALTNLEKDYTKVHAKLNKKNFIDKNDNIQFIDIAKDEEKIKKIVENGSFDDRYLTYLKLSYISEAENHYSTLTKSHEHTPLSDKCVQFQNDLLGVIGNEEYIDKHASQFNSMRTPMIEYSQRVLKNTFHENLKKLGVTENEASKEEAQIALLMTLSTNTAKLGFQFFGDTSIYFGSKFGIDLLINISLIERDPAFNSKVKVGNDKEAFDRSRIGGIKEKFIATLYNDPENKLAEKMKEAIYNEEKSYFNTLIEAKKLGYIAGDVPKEEEFDAFFNQYMVKSFVTIEEGKVQHLEIVHQQNKEKYDKFEEILKYESFLSESNIPEINDMLPVFKAYAEKITPAENRGNALIYGEERAMLQKALSDYLEKTIWTSDKETRKTLTTLLARINMA